MGKLREVVELNETVELHPIEQSDESISEYREGQRDIEALQILADQIYVRIQSNELPEYLINRLVEYHTIFLNQVHEKSLGLELSRLLSRFGNKLSVAIKLKEINDELGI